MADQSETLWKRLIRWLQDRPWLVIPGLVLMGIEISSPPIQLISEIQEPVGAAVLTEYDVPRLFNAPEEPIDPPQELDDPYAFNAAGVLTALKDYCISEQTRERAEFLRTQLISGIDDSATSPA